MRQQLNYTWMLKNLLKLYCIWTWDTLWGFFVLFCAVFFYFGFSSLFPLGWDNHRTMSEAPSPGLEAEDDPQNYKDWNIVAFELEDLYIFIFIYLFFIFIFIFYFFFFLFIFNFQSSLCLSNAFSAYGWLVHCLSLFIFLSFLFVLFFSTCILVFPFSFNFFAFHPLSPFHSKYHQCYYYRLENT
jgi:hypothetical protein